MTRRGLNLGHGFTHDLGLGCDACRLTEANCAYTGGCCPDCTHFAVPEVSQTMCPNRMVELIPTSRGRWAALCLDCFHISPPSRLISQTLAACSGVHGQRSVAPETPVHHVRGAA